MFDEKDLMGIEDNDNIKNEADAEINVDKVEVESVDYIEANNYEESASGDFEEDSVESYKREDQYVESEPIAEVTLEPDRGQDNGSFSNSQRPYEKFAENSNNNDYVWNSHPTPEPEPVKKTNKVKVILAIAAGVAVLILGIVTIGSGLDKIGSNNTNNNDNAKVESTNKANVEQVTPVQGNTKTNSGGVVITDVSDVVEEVMPSIVSITSKTKIDSGSYGFPNWGGNNEETTGAGSGIIIHQTDTELLILTNNHVVEGANSLSIQFINDKSVEASVKGTDKEHDLAIVAIPLDKLDSAILSSIKIATLGDSNSLRVGEGVVAIGNALGYGQSVTTGVISALDRQVQVDDNTKMTMLQTDAAINGGNSGGALINANGQVVGINAAKYSSSNYSTSSIEGMGFAIPISSTTDIVNKLMNKETKVRVDEKDRGYMGFYGANIAATDAEIYSMPEGVLISKLVSGGAAEKAGIEPRDIIVAVAGDDVKTMDEIKEVLTYYKKGDKIKVTIKYQDGKTYKEKEVELTLQANSEEE